MAGLKSHEDLVAWQLSDELEDRAYEITDRQAARRDLRFCDDFRRAARSAPNNLAEGFHRYRPRENARFVRIAIGSLGEVMNHLRHANKRKYITEEEHAAWTRLAKRARGAASRWLEYLESCPPNGPVRTSPEPRTRRTRPRTPNAEPRT